MLTLTDILRMLIKKQLQVHLRHLLFLKLGNNLAPASTAKIRLDYTDTSGIESWTVPCLHDILLLNSHHFSPGHHMHHFVGRRQ